MSTYSWIETAEPRTAIAFGTRAASSAPAVALTVGMPTVSDGLNTAGQCLLSLATEWRAILRTFLDPSIGRGELRRSASRVSASAGEKN